MSFLLLLFVYMVEGEGFGQGPEDTTGDELGAFLAAHKADIVPAEEVEEDPAVEKARQIAVDAKLKELVGRADLLDHLKGTQRDVVLSWYDGSAIDPAEPAPYPQLILDRNGELILREGNTKEATIETRFVLVHPSPDGSYEYQGRPGHIDASFSRLQGGARTGSDYLRDNPEIAQGGMFVAKEQSGGRGRGRPLADGGYFKRTAWGSPALTPDAIQKNLMSDLKQPAPIPPLGK